ncbi:MAG: hypothetical protein AABY53_02280 [Bdellovibrionota bacterium]
MKFVFITLFLGLFLVSNLVVSPAKAQSPDKDVAHTTDTMEKNEDIIGTIAEPTEEQKKHIKKAAKTAVKKAVKKLKHSKKVTQ